MASVADLKQGNHKDRWFNMAEELLSFADIKIGGNRPFDIQVHQPKFYKRIFQQGSLGLGESYMDGWWDCQALDVFFERILNNQLTNRMPQHLSDFLDVVFARIFNLQSYKRAWIVGKEHYDLGNELFEMMLDPYMQYSCGYWASNVETLEQAQLAKLDLICRKLELKPGMRLLDIGCGWGGLAEFAARNYGVKVMGVTISAQQQQLAVQRCEGLPVDICLKDYRTLHEQFDRIVSVGMFEHVGPKNYQTFFEVLQKNIKPNGLILLHTIGSNKSAHNVDAWINKYIFPNGVLPSIRYIAESMESRFVMEDWHNFGSDYDKTLMAWYQRFITAWPTIQHRYSERFQRMFSYYLLACAGAFRARDIQLWQILMSPSGVNGGLRVAR